MNNLWTFGDSFTAGHGCVLYETTKTDLYYEIYKDYVDPNKDIWPKIVAKKIDANLINEGINGATNDIIFDLVLKNILKFKIGDVVIIQPSTSMRFELPFKQRKSLFGANNKSEADRNHLYNIEDSPYFFKTIFTTNVIDNFKNVGENVLMRNITDGDKSLVLTESKYNIIKNFFDEFITTKKFYERELWRFCNISNIIESLGIKVYLMNEDEWSPYIKKPNNLINIDDVGMLTFIMKNKLTILHETNGKIEDYHPSYKGHETIAETILKYIKKN